MSSNGCPFFFGASTSAASLGAPSVDGFCGDSDTGTSSSIVASVNGFWEDSNVDAASSITASVDGLWEDSDVDVVSSTSLFPWVPSELLASSFMVKSKSLGSVVTFLMRTFVAMPTETSFKKLRGASRVGSKPVVYAVVPGNCNATTIENGRRMWITCPSNHSLDDRATNGDKSACESNTNLGRARSPDFLVKFSILLSFPRTLAVTVSPTIGCLNGKPRYDSSSLRKASMFVPTSTKTPRAATRAIVPLTLSPTFILSKSTSSFIDTKRKSR
mmetsp:Transcript_126590/g.253117  ORF Transcript_126590/g.253117 Transcript_126590/m.253117 type:complete len:273 (-) Transcript_126590:1227-2045(-)